ncbi:MAG TPA: TraB/GumN family protein [Archaeoglobus profundus]|nr:TraB/GumN family protein [Archaeoglobus profundus]
MIIIVGTAHVSKKSVEEVKKVIEEIKPEAVAVELCYKRYLALTKNKPQNIPITDVIKKGEAPMLLFQLILSYFQRKIGEKCGVRPGEDMLVAIEKAREIGADILLIDRDITITFKRFWNSLSLFEKIKLILYILRSLFSKEEIDVDEMLKEDILERLIKEFRKLSPSAAKVLIDERDAYMAANLLQAAKKYEKIVAIVGAGHKKGIEKYLRNPDLIPDIKELEKVEESRFSLTKLFSYTLVILIFLTFFAIVKINSELIIEAFIYWFLINGFLASLGALIAGAHPLSILGAFLSAWFTSLVPFIAAGWIAGLIEVKIRKPTFKDIEELVRVKDFKDLMRNKIFRTLLVVALTNIGSMIGTICATYYIMQIIGIDISKVLADFINNLIKINL